MALNLPNKYPGRFDATSTDHPQGKFKNRTSPTAQDGSYLERDWLNDWGGFFGALLRNAGLTPNETVDTAQSSQFYDAMMAVSRAGSFKNATAVTASSTTLTAAQVGQAFLFTTAASTVALPAASGIAAGGSYKLHTTAGFTLSVTGGGAMQAGNASVTSLSVPAGTEVLAVSTGAAWWVFGTGTISNSSLYSGLHATTGWRKCPDGIIEQWGTVTPTAAINLSIVSATFPIVFPNAVYNIQFQATGSADFVAGRDSPTGIILTTSGFTCGLYDRLQSAAVEAVPMYYKVIGK